MSKEGRENVPRGLRKKSSLGTCTYILFYQTNQK